MEDIERIGRFGELVINQEMANPASCKVRDMIKDCDIAITSWGCPLIDSYVLETAQNLKLVAHAAGTVKPIVTEELYNRGIRVTCAAIPLGKGVAETTLGLIITSLKDIFNLSKSTAEGYWNEGKKQVTEVYDVTIGLVGGGAVGRHLMKLLSNFEVKVLLFDPFVDEETAGAYGVKKVTFEELLSESDVVSLHAPSIDSTYHMMDARAFSLMKKDAILINTARGSLVDEDALYVHMKNGNLKYACIDVTDPEPPAADNPLRKLPNVIMTPHIAGLSNNGRKRIGKHIADEIERYMSGEKMLGEITKEVFERVGKT